MLKEPELIYHYTSFDALHSIISGISDNNLNLFLTHFEYLNDKHEIRGHFKNFKILFDEICLDEKCNNLLPERLLEIIFKLSTTFIFSFCQDGDSLNQWRSYCPNGGISIGFDYQQLKQSKKYFLKKCLYNEEEKKQAIGTIVKSNPQYFYTPDIDLPDYNKVFNLLTEVFLQFKHEAFIEEKEFRLIATLNNSRLINELKFRTRNNVFIPYYKLELDATLIKNVIIGPANNSERLKRDIEIMCKQKGLSPTIECSEIPLKVNF